MEKQFAKELLERFLRYVAIPSESDPRAGIVPSSEGQRKLALLLKSELYAEMGAQEFLDRESEWSLVFFLDDGLRWLNTRIVINDWVVRINHTEM